MKTEIEQLHNQIRSLAAGIRQLNKRVTELESDNANLRDRLEDADCRLETTRSKVRQVENKQNIS